MRIALTNNYDIAGIRGMWLQEGKNAPTQHLWGYAELCEMGHDVEIMPAPSSAWLKVVSRRLKVFGDIETQWRIFLNASQYDVIYSAHHLSTATLSALRVLRILRVPVVAVAFQVPRRKGVLARLFTKIFVAGNDKILCLSRQCREDMAELGVPAQRLAVASWGVDLAHYHISETSFAVQTPSKDPPLEPSQSAPPKPFLLSPGKAFRDFRSLAAGMAAITRCDLVIAGVPSLATESYIVSSANIRVLKSFVPWRELLKIYADAFAVLIPVDVGAGYFNNAVGLTNATEALAFGKPILATRNPYLGFDVEREGVGLWVDPYDSGGWTKAINVLLDNPDTCKRMGLKARALAETHYNIQAFSGQVAAAVISVVQSP